MAPFFSLRPVGIHHAVQQQDVDVIGAQLAAEAVEIGAHFLFGGGVGLGQNGDLFARHALQRFLTCGCVPYWSAESQNVTP